MIEGSDPITFLSVPFSRLYKGEGTRVGLGQGMIWESFRVQSFKVAREWINDSLTWKTVLVGCRLGSGEERPPSDIVMPYLLQIRPYLPAFHAVLSRKRDETPYDSTERPHSSQ